MPYFNEEHSSLHLKSALNFRHPLQSARQLHFFMHIHATDASGSSDQTGCQILLVSCFIPLSD